jgi:hypothetical protein
MDIDLDELEKSAKLVLEVISTGKRTPISPEAYLARWDGFHRAVNPAVILELIRRVREK